MVRLAYFLNEMRDMRVILVLKIVTTRKYPLRGYILGVLTHTTAWD